MLAPGIVLDARRAVFLEKESVLAVADLHLGYAWAHRHEGNLLPVSADDDTVARLLDLVETYAPRELVLLGDIVHRALSLPALKDELCALFAELSGRCRLRLVTGNHDRNLVPLLRDCGLDSSVVAEFRAGPHLLLHGDASDEDAAASRCGPLMHAADSCSSDTSIRRCRSPTASSRARNAHLSS